MASFTGGVMASRLPVISADAIAPLSPGRTARMRWSIASRMPSTTVAYRSQRLGACGISATRIRPSTKPEAPIRLKYMSRAKSYPPGRNGSSGGDSRALNSTNAADRRRGALAHRDPHALQRLIKPRTGNALDPHDDAVRALALFPDLDEARDIDVPDRRRQHGVSDDRALDGGGRQPSRQGGGTQRQGKRERSPPREDGRRRRRSEQEPRRPWRGLAVDGEIDRDAATKCDCEPGHEPSRADLDRHPRADALCRAGPRNRRDRPAMPVPADGRPRPTVRPGAAKLRPCHALCPARPSRPPDARDTTSAMLHERHARRIRLGSCIHSQVAGRASYWRFPAVFAGKARAGRTPEAVPFPAHCRCARRRVGC